MSVETQEAVKLVLFDYGGVLAAEGFTQGLMAIGSKHDLDPEKFFHAVTEIIYECGYVTGHCLEDTFWQLVGERTGIKGSDSELTHEILDRFILRPLMMELVVHLRHNSIRTAILSDQTDWLDRLDQRDDFFKFFDPVINSFHVGRTKRDPASFMAAADLLKLPPAKILFIDDNSGHIARAAKLGMQTHMFSGIDGFSTCLNHLKLL